MHLELSIIIVNYNVKYFLEQCLYSVRSASGSIHSEVIVIDNASSDGSMEYLLQIFPEVLFIDNPENVGFSRANNQGLLQAKGRYILFLNPDTILAEDTLLACMRFLESDKQAGACGVRMLDGSGKFLPESKRAFPGIKTSFYKLSGLTGLFPGSPRFGKYHLAHLSEFDNAEIDILSGAFFMVKKSVLDLTGNFDESFFMYGEDIDLSYRIQMKGFKNYYFAKTSIIHFKGESTKKGTFNYVKLFYAAMDIFVKKHYSKTRSGQLAFMIRMSVWLKGMLSILNKTVIKPGTKMSNQPIRSTIIGCPALSKTVESILQKQPIQRSLVQLSSLEKLKEQPPTNKADEIIFCTDELSYGEIIREVEHLPGYNFYIHAAGSNSIVGSNSKNTSGLVMGG